MRGYSGAHNTTLSQSSPQSHIARTLHCLFFKQWLLRVRRFGIESHDSVVRRVRVAPHTHTALICSRDSFLALNGLFPAMIRAPVVHVKEHKHLKSTEHGENGYDYHILYTHVASGERIGHPRLRQLCRFYPRLLLCCHCSVSHSGLSWSLVITPRLFFCVAGVSTRLTFSLPLPLLPFPSRHPHATPPCSGVPSCRSNLAHPVHPFRSFSSLPDTITATLSRLLCFSPTTRIRPVCLNRLFFAYNSTFHSILPLYSLSLSRICPTSFVCHPSSIGYSSTRFLFPP